MQEEKTSVLYMPPKIVEEVQEEAMEVDQLAGVRCCMCGIVMEPNPSNTCLVCLKNKIDITEGITKSLILNHCRGCNRFNGPPWMECALESGTLLSLCLKKIKGLKEVKLVDAKWIWTEPNSRRVQLDLTV
jgi:nonsense-mediated mRNA decay protein 3